jgi:predicted HicB family RNase H-like nuclease
MSDDTEIYSFAEARKKWGAKLDTTKAARKARHKKLAESVDGRSLRATGRVEQFNFRCSEGLKEKAQSAARRAGITLAEWMERAVEAAIAAEDGQGEGGCDA